MWIDGPDFLQHRQAVHLGHAKIEDRHTGIVLSKQIQPLQAARRRMHVVPVARQDGLEQVTIHAVVVDDENLDHDSCPALWMPRTARPEASLSWGPHTEK